MDLSFALLPDGIIEISVDPGHEVLTTALNDSVTSRAPRGSEKPGLSTYWIDRVESAVRMATEQGSTEPFASGNVTYLRLDGEAVVAGLDYDPEEAEAESIPLGTFLLVLGEWRQRIIEAGGASGTEAQAVAQDHQPIALPPSEDA